MTKENHEKHENSFMVEDKVYDNSKLDNNLDDMTKLAGTIEALALLKTIRESSK